MRRMFVAVLGAVALVLAGCADQEGGLSSGDSESLTKAEYIVKADDICRDVKQAGKTYKDQLAALPADSRIRHAATLIEGGLAQTRKGQERLRALPAPSEDRATLDAFHATVDRALAAGDQIVVAAQTSDDAKAEKVIEGNAGIAAEQKRLAQRYGLKVCGTG